MRPPLLCAISVDLDEIPNYHAIHGRSPAANGGAIEGATAVYDVALPRLVALAGDLGVPMTFFCVGDDLAREGAAQSLRAAVAAGHGVGNHTQSHRYDFTRLDRPDIAREIDDAETSIARACGVRTRGFRAPGYTITDTVFKVLRGLGYAWDSSVFPCPSYMAAKNTAIGLYSALGRPSRSIVDTPKVLLAPTRPYRIGAPYWRRGDGLLELPIQVTRAMRLPYIGTTVMTAGATGARALTSMVVGEPLVNLELHGVDLLDDRDEGLASLATSQRDLRVSVERKKASLAAVVERLRASGYAFVTMDEAAAAFAKA